MNQGICLADLARPEDDGQMLRTESQVIILSVIRESCSQILTGSRFWCPVGFRSPPVSDRNFELEREFSLRSPSRKDRP